MSIFFRDHTFEEIQSYIDRNALVILPVGTIEEHGPHLPVETDVRIAEEVAKIIGEEMKDEIPLLVMPGVWAGYSPKVMADSPGNMQLKPRVFEAMIHDICASLIEMGFRKIMMLDCHGRHAPMLNMATKELADEYGAYICVTSPLTFSAKEFNEVRKSERGGVLHACEWETALMMRFSEHVHMDRVISEPMRYHSDFVSGDSAMSGQKVVWSTWGLQKAKHGVYGDPEKATLETAEVIIAALKKNYRAFMLEYWQHPGREG